MRVWNDTDRLFRPGRASSVGVDALRNPLWMWDARALCTKCRGAGVQGEWIGPKMMAIRRLQNLWSGYGSYPFFTDL
jgi:hypothetical protein